LVNKAKDIIEANYDKPIDISHISKQLGVSTNHLIRLFKQISGLTPAHYITKLRISKSAELLEQADKNIIEIAYISGFYSLSNFYKHFKELIGQTPNEYRKSRGGL
ncbi:MAG TPA: AraC family transcriptional regulator, partial [Clostridia bacterium]|nr:AraC family transcriptional regulator [Clostridia bacterium]